MNLLIIKQIVKLSLTFILAALVHQNVIGQITNGEINYELRIDQWRQTCDNDGFTNDDNEVRVGLTSDANTGGSATWTSGGNGATCTGNNYVRRWQADAPSTVTNTNTLMYFCLNRTNTQNLFRINYSSWEEDGSPDCSESGDACVSAGAYDYTFKSAAKTPSQWWSYTGVLNGGFMTGNSGDFFAKTVWRYTNGISCANPLIFGTLSSGATVTHTNSNRSAPAGATAANMGYSNSTGNTANDVFYQFTITTPSSVTISTDNGGTNFDTYLRLYDGSCGSQLAFNDDGGSGVTSAITMDLCSGTYIINVEGFGANNGEFELSVVATNKLANGGNIAGITNGSTICSGSDPGAFSDLTSPTGAGALAYQWEVSTTSSIAGYSIISGETALTYDPSALTQTSWFRRRVTDGCGQVAYSNIIQVIVGSNSTALTAISGASSYVCPNTTTTLTASGGTAGTGSQVFWYSGANGTGTLLGTGTSINVAPTGSTTYYARREGTCNTTADFSVTLNVKTYIYAANGTSTSTYCTDNAGWNHFFVGNNIVFSCQGDLSGAPVGFPQVTINNNASYYQAGQGPNSASDCASNLSPGEERFEMSRSWNLSLGGGTSIPPYNVRFYYQTAEKTAIETAASNWIASYPACGYTYKYATPLGFYWFKNTSGSYNPAQYDGLHLTGSIGSTSNGINYTELTGITSFSGGSGSIILVPIATLPVELASFSAECSSKTNDVSVNWSTNSEHNSSHYVLERSTDSENWFKVETLPAAGQSQSLRNYEVIDMNARNSKRIYYRLKQFDQNGDQQIIDPIIANCEMTENEFYIYPNPADSKVTLITRNTELENKDVIVEFYDMNSRLIESSSFSKELKGSIDIDVSQLLPGIYMVVLNSNDTKTSPIRLVIK